MAYDDQHRYRGLALVIGNETFDRKDTEENIDRDGCEEDINNMNQMFERLDFFVMCFKDLTAAEIKEKIELASKDARNEYCDGFVLVLSTHGCETFDTKNNVWRHEVMGTDRENVMVEDILKMFDKQNATGLAGKPKIFFIQACRDKDRQGNDVNDATDPGIIADIPVSNKSAYAEKSLPFEFSDDKSYSECDDIYKDWPRDPACWLPAQDKKKGDRDAPDAGGGVDNRELPPEPVDILRIKCPEDCLLYYPVVSGKNAFKNPKYGSYMMVSLWKQFPKLLRGLSLHQYLTYVNRAMADHKARIQRQNGEKALCKMTASVVHRMTKRVIFVPKSKNSPMARAKEIIERYDN